ncbi:hypothetical protein HYDPIDRAFT_120393 [Hydnomerulius pinastri MD-312]|uniref:Uncharacterized protein n=1 Tax=Hydnomerulius pinastri MD-312 TaxID=994086 RepID=A0A0C9UXI2_9AGAM|nr:hypothetical protein HYDPIDRAFT_120393 [Hydnomerulius pinastri MD-312]
MDFDWNDNERLREFDPDAEDARMDGLGGGDPHSGDEDDAAPPWARPLPFEEVAQAPFDVGQVPDYQQVDDPVPQQDVLAAIQRETRSDRNYSEEFNSRSVYDRRLSSLEMYSKEDRAGHAISFLKERSRLVVDQ